MGRFCFILIRGLRPFSFPLAYALSIAAILGFALWIVVDSSFGVLLDVVLIDLRLRPHPGIAMGPVHSWGELGSRLAILGVMTVAGFGGLLVVLARSMAGKGTDRTVRGMMLATALVAAWLGLAVSYQSLDWFGFKFRIKRELPSLKAIAARLREAWPRDGGTLPGLGDYQVDASAPDYLLIGGSRSEYPMREKVGWSVRRSKHGAILFQFERDAFVEYHRDGRSPRSFSEAFSDFSIRRDLIHAEILEQNWYLASYSVSSTIGE